MEYTPELEMLEESIIIENIHLYNISYEDSNLILRLKEYKVKRTT